MKAVRAWAPLLDRGDGTELMAVASIGRTREESRRAWLSEIPADKHTSALIGVRFVRVTITIDEPRIR